MKTVLRKAKEERHQAKVAVGEDVTQHVQPEDIGAYEGPKKYLQMYHIYHAINKRHMFQEVEKQPRKYVGYILANSIEAAFTQTQNDSNNPDYIKLKVRSTSVGDLFQDGFGFYMIQNHGFKLVCLVDEDGAE